ncbi:MAG: DUF3153 domain-containing protein [Cyanobacteria bacterium J06638_20]
MLFKRWISIALICFACLGLSGCVRYDLGIHYFSQTRGEIVQQIRVGESVTSFNAAIARTWLQTLEKQAKAVGGYARRRSAEELTVRIPFHNGAELNERFNAFFAVLAEPPAEASEDTLPLPEIASHLMVQEQNLVLVQRNRLSYDLDLRSLRVRSPGGNVLVKPSTLLELNFSLDTPWGAVVQSGSVLPRGATQGRHLEWRFTTADINHLEVMFWVPSPLGIGTAIIILLVLLGSAVKALILNRSAAQRPEGL